MTAGFTRCQKVLHDYKISEHVLDAAESNTDFSEWGQSHLDFQNEVRVPNIDILDATVVSLVFDTSDNPGLLSYSTTVILKFKLK